MAETDVHRLPEVVVEGAAEQKQGNSQQTPASLSTISADEVKSANIRTVEDLAPHVPNLSISENALRSFGDTYGIRGLVNTPFFSDPSVVLYVDDVPYGNAFSYSSQLFDVEEVRVFRGPQGHLFGKNSEAGVIEVRTRQPMDRFQAHGSFTYGSYDFQSYQAGLMGPILTNSLYFGFAGIYSRRDGLLRNTNLKTDPDTQKALNGRFSLRWTPTTEWDLTFTVGAEDYDDGTQRIVPLNGSHFKVASDFDGDTSTEANSQSLRAAYRADDFTFLSITSRRDWSLDPFTLDLDLSPFVGNTAEIKQDQVQWTQELRFESPSSAEEWKWRAGFFFSTSEIESDSTRNFFVFPPGFFANERTQFTLDDDNYALFGQLTWAATEKFAISLGSRFDYTVKSIDRSKTSTLGAVAPIERDKDFFNAAPKLTLEYQCSDSVMVYGSTGLGFKPGGYSGFVDPPSSSEFDTELSWVNEIGAKSSWFDKRLFADVALFYYDIWDYQVERPVPGTTDLTIVNAPEAFSCGAEAEVTAIPIEGLQLSAVFGFTWAEFDRFKDPSSGADLAGNRVPFTPEFNAGLSAQYRHRVGAFARVELDAFGETYYDEVNTQSGKQSSYGLLSAKVGYERRHFQVYLFGNNLTDKKYFTNKRVDLNAGVPGEPATIGVTASLRY